MNTADKLKRSRISLLLDQPFFGALLLGLQMRKASGETKTMATDGVNLVYTDEMINELESEKHVVTILAHESLHCALLHHLRRGDRDLKQWNDAGDKVINGILERCNESARKAGKAEPFPWSKKYIPLLDDTVGPEMSIEEVYTRDYRKPQPNDDGDSPGDGIGGVTDSPAKDGASQQEEETKWKVALDQAAKLGKLQGNMPAELARLVSEILNPPTPVEEILRQFITEKAADDYSWSRPNTRYLASGFILPSLYSQKLGTIAIGIDTSGSIGGPVLDRFLSVVENIVHECKPERLIVIDCDSRVNSIRTIEHGDSIPREYKGGGGTDLRKVFDKIEEEIGDYPVCLVMFTDLETPFPAKSPAYPVLWATNSKNIAPFGITAELI